MDKQSLTRLQRQLTGKYVATNGLFWMAYVCIWGFGAVYLKGKGFSSTETGIITALVDGYQYGTEGVNENSVVLSAKHFPGDGAAENGFESHVSQGQWRLYPTEGSLEKYHLSGFQAAIDAGVKRIVVIPVCYGGEFGPDLPTVAHHAGMSEQDVVSLHCAHDYLIDMLGFLPGFAYLGGLDPRLHTPRLSVPRTEIPAGSVGIGGAQTGIYPLASPGGWQIIGRSPVRPYDPERAQPILYRAGEYLRFQPITQKQYDAIEAQIAAGGYECDVIVEEV